jgi:hypothetical protein
MVFGLVCRQWEDAKLLLLVVLKDEPDSRLEHSWLYFLSRRKKTLSDFKKKE